MKGFKSEQLHIVQAKPRISGNRLGRILSIESDQRIVVDFIGNPIGPQPARVVASLSTLAVMNARVKSLPVLLLFEDNDPARPVIVDVVVDFPTETSLVKSELPKKTRHTRIVSSCQSQVITVPRLARIIGIEDDFVLVEGETSMAKPLKARTSITLRNLKDPVLLLAFSDGSVVIIGQIFPLIPVEPSGGEGVADVLLKGSRVTIEADVELVLKSGACTITLDARGKAVTTADQILSRARGSNKVQGGSVQLN